jgi:uncharacterized membrane protein
MSAFASKPSCRVAAPAFLLGVAMSGFFDGILLHQVLQWHHLLSLAPGTAFRDPRVQVFADGLFHVLMYLLAIIALVLFWRRRSHLTEPDGARVVAGSFVAGFGAWNIADVGLFHWVMQIHNIRLDVPNPIAWDVGWLVVFGVLPLIGAMLIFSRRGGDPPSRGGKVATSTITLTIMAGLWALAPVPGATSAVLFRPGLTDVQRWAAIARADARVLATDVSGDLMIVSLPQPSARWRLLRDGGLVVGGAMGGGCLTVPSDFKRS